MWFSWRDHVLSSKVSVCCVCDSNLSVSVPSMYIVCVCMSEVIYTFNAA